VRAHHTRKRKANHACLYAHKTCFSVHITEFSTSLILTLFYHRLVGRGPTGVTLLEVGILFTEFFRSVCGSDTVDDPNTFFVRAAVGFM